MMVLAWWKRLPEGPIPTSRRFIIRHWNNYLDRMQQEGGYYSVTGNYPGSSPVTSYYPASQSSEATSPQPGAGQSSIYYNPSEYYSNQGGAAYQAPQVQTYQAPDAAGQAVTGAQQGVPAAGKKRRLKAKRSSGKAQLQATYQQSPYPQTEQVDPQAYAQQQAYQQQLQAYQQQQGYAQQQAGYPQQQAQQQPGAYPAGQDASYQQQGYGQSQQQAAQPQSGEAQGALSSDPIVQAAQQKAYERAVARQRAAELAAQQQAATQELTQAQQQFAMAQQRVREQEAKQKALQAEYHKKAVGEAYEGLRAAQQRYCEFMGVSGDSGRPAQTSYQARAVPQAPGQQQALQYPQMAPGQQPQQPQAQQQYGQPAPTPQGVGQLQYAGPAPAAAGAMPSQPTITPYQAPPGQSTPLHVQGQQQQQAESGGGLWSTLKEIFASPTTAVGPNQQRSMFEGRNKSRYSD